MEQDWQLVYSAKSAIDAEMVRGMLENNGIEAVVMNKQDSSYLFGDVEVYVSKEHSPSAATMSPAGRTRIRCTTRPKEGTSADIC